jgi:hypothetical protein
MRTVNGEQKSWDHKKRCCCVSSGSQRWSNLSCSKLETGSIGSQTRWVHHHLCWHGCDVPVGQVWPNQESSWILCKEHHRRKWDWQSEQVYGTHHQIWNEYYIDSILQSLLALWWWQGNRGQRTHNRWIRISLSGWPGNDISLRDDGPRRARWD